MNNKLSTASGKMLGDLSPIYWLVNFFYYAATVLSPQRNVLILTYRQAVYAINCIYTPFSKCLFVLRDLDQSQELQTIAKESLQFHMFTTEDFFVIQTGTRFCYMENGLKVRMNICTAL